ncbi:transporter substrate-binding domain-containing protein [Phaeovibrio sulfidiphilus]|uniref:Transporter substrate-binding domain-containing protein n=1 Tax=Phaeovibrio sulfidiphilus TaxID=1220600 RepID=A0A8J7CCZ5_9PROT|nr:transporter substrate-binding domain-containing protein [Phaeovibrio sulfidiphilus]MBE1236424.1 transporter substrate-binding domain-containing protein [Phaeovibrio sulfidiphilus]
MGSGFRRLRRVLAAVLVAGSGLVLLPGPAAAETLRIGSDGTCDLFRLRGSADKGVDVDVVRALCARMGSTCERVTLGRAALVSALEAGTIDAAVLPVEVARDAGDRLALSGSYYCSSIRFVAPKGEGSEPDRDGLRGKRIGVVRDTLASAWLEAAVGDTASVRSYDTLDEALGDLAGLRLEAVLSESCPLNDWVRSPAGLQFALRGEPVMASGQVVVATRADDPRGLAPRFDSALQAVVACCRVVGAPGAHLTPGSWSP